MEKTEKNEEVKQTSARNNISIPKKPVFLPSQLSSYKGIIIAICFAILAWMLLQWDHQSAFKDANKYAEKEHKTSFFDKTKDNLKTPINNASENIKNSYQQTAEIVNDKMQETIDKVKKMGHLHKEEKKKSTIQENVKDSVDNVVKKQKKLLIL